MTKVLKADNRTIAEAARLINKGELVGMPTETVYGLGADALNEAAVLRIFAAKDRPPDNPLIVHISELAQIAPLIECEIPEVAKRLADAYWPGPLTMIFSKSDVVPLAVTAGLQTVAIRLPAHPVARQLIESAKTPIAAPSANRSGRPSPTTAQHVYQDMNGRIPLILDGGACDVGLESTVVDFSSGKPRVLRPGGVTPEMIYAVAGEVEVDGSVLRPLERGETARSPGMKYRHYAPSGDLSIVEGSLENVVRKIAELYDAAIQSGQSARILSPAAHASLYEGRAVRALGAKDSADAIAADLFVALREMDDQKIEVILAEGIRAVGVGLAVMNRLNRAAGFHTINADEG